jgi:hypothetical protein
LWFFWSFFVTPIKKLQQDISHAFFGRGAKNCDSHGTFLRLFCDFLVTPMLLSCEFSVIPMGVECGFFVTKQSIGMRLMLSRLASQMIKSIYWIDGNRHSIFCVENVYGNMSGA